MNVEPGPEPGVEPGVEPGIGSDEPELPPIPDALLAPLLESAGEALRKLPATDLPPAARRLRSFDRRGLATPAARHQLRQLLEEDEVILAAAAALFRSRPDAAALAAAWDEAVAAGGDAGLELAGEAAAGGRLPLLASVLVSGLPDWFEFGLGLVVALATTAGRESDAARAVKAATAGRQAAEEAARRAEAARATAEADAARLDAALRDERQAHRQRDQEAAGAAAGLEARRAELEAALGEARRQLADAEQRRAAAETKAAEAGRRAIDTERRAEEAERRATEAERRAEEAERRAPEAERWAIEAQRGAGGAAAAGAEAAAAGPVAEGLPASAGGADAGRRPTEAAEERPLPPGGAGGTVLDEIARAAEDLAAGLRRLADGAEAPPLRHAADPSRRRAAGDEAGPRPRRAGGDEAAPGPRRAADRPAGSAPPRSRPKGRAPVRLPPGMMQDDPAAVAAIVRTPGVAVIVDGYNVSMLAWAGASAAEQRERLCDALAEFQLRFRCEVTVVFDGAEVAGGRQPLRRRNLRVVFSAAGQEADEVVVGEVMLRPPEVPVIVVSSDREVQAAAESEGAAVLGADALLQLMRR